MTNNTGKVSLEFAARLNDLEPKQHIRLIFILSSETKKVLNDSDNENKAKHELIKRITDDVHSAKGYILALPDSLGLMEVEIKVENIPILSQFEWIKHITENQKVYPIEPMR